MRYTPGEIERLRGANKELIAQLLMHRCLSNAASGTVRECIKSGRCGCCNGLLIPADQISE